MKVGELIKELEKQNAGDEIVLWRWIDKGTCYSFLNILLPHKNPKEVYEIGINETMPNIHNKEELESFIRGD